MEGEEKQDEESPRDPPANIRWTQRFFPVPSAHFPMKLRLLPAVLAVTLALAAQASLLRADDAPKPLKILLITGGCCHDYAKQKDILKEGLEARANVVVDQIHTDDKSVKPPLPIYGN